MKVLFVTTEHPANVYGGLGTFTREFTRELRKHCEVRVAYFHLSGDYPPPPDDTVDYVLAPAFSFEAHSAEARALEAAACFRSLLEPLLREFRPDVIHCNDRQTFMPFRFDANVLYSSHLLFCDMLSLQAIDDVYLQELKVERCALARSAALVVYSRFAAKRAATLVPSASPVVLPLGFDPARPPRQPDDGRLRAAYFGRFENVQKGYAQFVEAVNLLGKKFLDAHAVEVSMFGKGTVSAGLDVSLMSNVSFLEGEELARAFSRTDIVVMPSRYEPFGLVGLEAMASGCLLLCTEGLGMDEYATNGKTCVTIPRDALGIADVLAEVIEHFDRYRPIVGAGQAAARKWTWERCVRAHLAVYRHIASGRATNVRAAYRSELSNVLARFRRSDGPILPPIQGCAVPGRRAAGCLRIVAGPRDRCDPRGQGDSCACVSVTEPDEDGIVQRLECLSASDGQYPAVCVAGAWESVLDPALALRELFRVASDSVTIWYRTGIRLPWQTVCMEGADDWRALRGSDQSVWKLSSHEDRIHMVPASGYAAVRWIKQGAAA